MAETITSSPIQTPVGTAGTKLETFTQTTFTRDANGKIDPKSVKTEILLNNSTIPGVKKFVPAAASTDGGKTWDTSSSRYQKPDGSPVFGADAQKSLKEGALRTNTNQQIATAATKAKISPEQQKALSANQINNAQNQTTGDVTQPIQLNIEGSGGQRDKVGSFGNHQYPEKLSAVHQDVIKFTMQKYDPRQFQTGQGNLGGFAERNQKRTLLGSVTLPIPSGISETNGAQWGEDRMDPAAALAANVALTGITKGAGEAVDKVGEALTAAQGSGDVQTAVAAGFAQAATGIGGLLARTQGAILNPNMELLFQNPTLRPFNFSFKLSARSELEAKSIIKIIRFFKQGMSPQKSASNLFLKAPHTFKIQYLHIGNDHPYIGGVKECALQNFVVNYTPEGQYATFTDGVLVSYEIQMTFQELEPVFNEDYGNDGSEVPADLLFRANQSINKP